MATRKSGQRARSGASAPRMGPKAAAKKAGKLYVKALVAPYKVAAKPLKLAAKGARKVVKAATPRVGRAAKRQTTFTKKVISGQDLFREKDTPKKRYIAKREKIPLLAEFVGLKTRRRRSPKGGGT